MNVDLGSISGDEQLGSKSKFWFQHEGQDWLFKQARDSTGEDWAEKIAAEVAQLVGVNAARVELAIYQGRKGSASLSFMQAGESLVHGNEILAGQIVGYDPKKKLKQSDHTLGNIIAAVSKMASERRDEVLVEFAGYTTLDALICNTDRHHENWGFLARAEGAQQAWQAPFRLAPSFDHASSLGRELLDSRARSILDANGIADYVRRGRGGIYVDAADRRGANPIELIEQAAASYPTYLRNALQGVRSTELGSLHDVVDQVPESVMSATSHEFAKALLAHTHRLLSGLAT